MLDSTASDTTYDTPKEKYLIQGRGALVFCVESGSKEEVKPGIKIERHRSYAYKVGRYLGS